MAVETHPKQYDMTEETPVVETDEAVFEFPTKEAQFGHYELLILVPGQFSDEDALAIYGDVKKMIAEFGGEITIEDLMGRKTLGYKVQGLKNGSYFAVEFDMDRANTSDLQQKVRIRKEIDRFMMITKRKKSAEQLEDEKKRKEKRMIHRQVQKQKIAEEEAEEREAEKAEKRAKVAEAEKKAEKPEEAKEESKKDSKEEKTAPEAVSGKAVEKPEEKKAITLEDIDKKIDDILSDDITL